MYFPILYHCIGIGIHISALPWRLCDGSILGSLRPAVVALIAGAGLSMLLAAVLPEVNGERMIQWGSLVLFGSFYSAPQMETEPNSCDDGSAAVSALAVKLIEYHL